MFKDIHFKEAVWYLVVAGVGLLLVLTLSSLWDVFAKWGLVVPAGQAQTATLSAEGVTSAIPDTARFTAGVVTEGLTPEAVQAENAVRINAVISFLKEQGVEEEDIKTVGFNLTPIYNFFEGERSLEGYELRQSVQVETKELEIVGILVSGVVDAGANQVTQVNLFIKDPDAIKAAARKEAIAKIEQKKREMRRELGVRFGRVVGVFESGNGAFRDFAVSEQAVGIGGGRDVPNIEPGTQEVRVTVSVTYQLK